MQYENAALTFAEANSKSLVSKNVGQNSRYSHEQKTVEGNCIRVKCRWVSSRNREHQKHHDDKHLPFGHHWLQFCVDFFFPDNCQREYPIRLVRRQPEV